MPYLLWTDNLNTGIDVIDNQHRQIVDYINQLHDAKSTNNLNKAGDIIEAMIDYTISHFGFEETLMEDAGYEFLRPHKRVHELFINRIADFQERYQRGEDILDELDGLLNRWLINHIKHDDASYVSAVKPKVLAHVQEEAQTNWISRSLNRFFGI